MHACGIWRRLSRCPRHKHIFLRRGSVFAMLLEDLEKSRRLGERHDDDAVSDRASSHADLEIVRRQLETHPSKTAPDSNSNLG